MNKVDKDELFQLYVVEKKPMHKIASEMKIAVGTVYNYLHRYGIETREPRKGFLGKTHSNSVRKKISDANKGKCYSNETRFKMSESHKTRGIGHKKKRSDGYIAIYFPDHPKSSKDGYIMEHILVMEALIGRHLKDDECVHHINEDKTDNRKENLKLTTKIEHMSYHSKKRHEDRRNDLSIK